MNLLGIHISLWISKSGPPRPVPIEIAQAVKDINVTHNDDGPSGFQITFNIGRSGPLDLMDYALLKHPLLKPFNRVILIVRFAIAPQVLMDGIITNIQMSPGDGPGTSTLTVTGEDVSVMMDLEENMNRSFPAQPDYVAVQEIIKSYDQYGLIPSLPPLNQAALTPVIPTEQIHNQLANMTDRAYLNSLAGKYGFIFYLTPGPAPLVNTVHWGPPERMKNPQSALSVNMGSASNVKSINFSYDALKPQKVEYDIDDNPKTNNNVVINEPSFNRIINCAKARKKVKKSYTGTDTERKAQAQGDVDRSFYSVVTANGELDVLRYGRLLNPRTLVGLRGAGKSYDGNYYVKNVSHKISIGSYNQSFTLTREGTETIFPFIIP